MHGSMDSFQIAMLIKEVYSATTNIVSHSLKECGLTHQQVMIIKLIGHKKEITISELCEEMSLSKGTVSGIVQRLEMAGYVKKVKSEQDKRNTYVTFSDKGIEFAREFKSAINSGFDEVFDNLTPEESQEVQKALKLLSSKIKEKEKSWMEN